MVEPFVLAANPGALCIYGPPGSGKSTALAHLAATFGPRDHVEYLDDAVIEPVAALSGSKLVIYTAPAPLHEHVLSMRLAPWGLDEYLEYLMALHRARCASVLGRLRDGDDAPRDPELAALCMDQMAADDRAGDADTALRLALDRVLVGSERLDGGRAGLMALTGFIEPVPPPPPSEAARRLFRHGRIQLLLAAEELVRRLSVPDRGLPFSARLPYALVQSTGALAVRHPEAVGRLEAIVHTGLVGAGMAASILFAPSRSWRPPEGDSSCLSQGYFPSAEWPGVSLWGADLTDADLSRANLERAVLDEARLEHASMRGCSLKAASLVRADLSTADLTNASLEGAQAAGANFVGANLSGADLQGAHLERATLCRANLKRARLCRANLRTASLVGACLDESDFSMADLEAAHLERLDLRKANFRGAVFRRANLHEANLEGMELPGACFEGAFLRGPLMTASRMPMADFRGADLTGAGLAEVDWSGADLRDADLDHILFHMGTSRSGLVPGGVPGLGTRTGFYTDDYNDQSFKAPEEIRKANLRGANLVGARIENADFYLVDLRDAIYTPDQEEHLRQCGAILKQRV